MRISPGMTKRKRSEHYVNNKEFLAALIKYREDVEIAKLRDKPKLAFSTYIILILRNPKILLLTLRRLYIMRFSAEYKEKNVN